MMRVLVTEAASDLAYNLVALLASGDVIPHQHIELVLCDTEDSMAEMQGLSMELQDCALPSLTGVGVSTDMCDTLREVDLALILPRDVLAESRGSCRQIHINHTALEQVNFRSLNGAFGASKTALKEISKKSVCHGPLSTAHVIAQYVRNVYLKQVEKDLRERLALHEEAEFGMCLDAPPDAGPSRLSLMFVSSVEESQAIRQDRGYALDCVVSRL